MIGRDLRKKDTPHELLVLEWVRSTGLGANPQEDFPPYVVDIYIPDMKLAIEIDGPAHFLPIWGEESLQKHIRADAEKAGLLIARGYAILRVKNVIRNLSAKNMRDALEGVITAVKKVEKKFPPQSKRLIEIET